MVLSPSRHRVAAGTPRAPVVRAAGAAPCGAVRGRRVRRSIRPTWRPAVPAWRMGSPVTAPWWPASHRSPDPPSPRDVPRGADAVPSAGLPEGRGPRRYQYQPRYHRER